jgi:hypothetical protein
VTEQGTHEELLSLGGRYGELFRLQARRFAAGDEEPEEDFEELAQDSVVGRTGTAGTTSGRGSS